MSGAQENVGAAPEPAPSDPAEALAEAAEAVLGGRPEDPIGIDERATLHIALARYRANPSGGGASAHLDGMRRAFAHLNAIYCRDIDLGDPPCGTPAWVHAALDGDGVRAARYLDSDPDVRRWIDDATAERAALRAEVATLKAVAEAGRAVVNTPQFSAARKEAVDVLWSKLQALGTAPAPAAPLAAPAVAVAVARQGGWTTLRNALYRDGDIFETESRGVFVIGGNQSGGYMQGVVFVSGAGRNDWDTAWSIDAKVRPLTLRVEPAEGTEATGDRCGAELLLEGLRSVAGLREEEADQVLIEVVRRLKADLEVARAALEQERAHAKEHIKGASANLTILAAEKRQETERADKAEARCSHLAADNRELGASLDAYKDDLRKAEAALAAANAKVAEQDKIIADLCQTSRDNERRANENAAKVREAESALAAERSSHQHTQEVLEKSRRDHDAAQRSAADAMQRVWQALGDGDRGTAWERAADVVAALAAERREHERTKAARREAERELLHLKQAHISTFRYHEKRYGKVKAALAAERREHEQTEAAIRTSHVAAIKRLEDALAAATKRAVALEADPVRARAQELADLLAAERARVRALEGDPRLGLRWGLEVTATDGPPSSDRREIGAAFASEYDAKIELKRTSPSWNNPRVIDLAAPTPPAPSQEDNRTWKCDRCGVQKHATLSGARASGWFVDEATWCGECSQRTLATLASGNPPAPSQERAEPDVAPLSRPAPAWSVGIPCVTGYVAPCRSGCSCANPIMSGGCDRCAAHGSDEQVRHAAEEIARRLDGEPKRESGAVREAAERVERAATLWARTISRGLMTVANNEAFGVETRELGQAVLALRAALSAAPETEPSRDDVRRMARDFLGSALIQPAPQPPQPAAALVCAVCSERVVAASVRRGVGPVCAACREDERRREERARLIAHIAAKIANLGCHRDGSWSPEGAVHSAAEIVKAAEEEASRG